MADGSKISSPHVGCNLCARLEGFPLVVEQAELASLISWMAGDRVAKSQAGLWLQVQAQRTLQHRSAFLGSLPLDCKECFQQSSGQLDTGICFELQNVEGESTPRQGPPPAQKNPKFWIMVALFLLMSFVNTILDR